MNTTQPTKLLKIEEAAALINLSRSTLYRLAQAKSKNGLDKAAKKKGGQWRFDASELLAWDSQKIKLEN
jgi:excisionase family DNA binding protein